MSYSSPIGQHHLTPLSLVRCPALFLSIRVSSIAVCQASTQLLHLDNCFLIFWEWQHGGAQYGSWPLPDCPQYRNGTEGSHLFPLRNDWLLLQSSAGWDWIYEPGRYYYLQHFSITDMFYFTHKYLPVGPRYRDKQDRTPATWPNQDWVNLCESDGIFCQQNFVKFCPEVDTGPVSSVWRRWRL